MKPFRVGIVLFAAGAIGITFGGRLVQGARTADATPPVHLTDQQDHQRLMDLLHIDALRPGRNGSDKSSPRYANYDESKATPYPDLPDPLRLKNGKETTEAADWWKKRRPEIVEDFDREIYAASPKTFPR